MNPGSFARTTTGENHLGPNDIYTTMRQSRSSEDTDSQNWSKNCGNTVAYIEKCFNIFDSLRVRSIGTIPESE